MSEPLTPRDATLLDQIIRLPRDNVDTEEHWLMVGPDCVTLAKQKTGEEATAVVHIPRDVFDAFIDWYNTGQWKEPKAGRKKK